MKFCARYTSLAVWFNFHNFFFFFKQKTAYEMQRGLVGSEMCIRDRYQRRVHGSYLGGHAIEVIGWGFEQDLPYWLCKNSWGEAFGDKGFFKIAIGECSVNDNMISCQPAIQCF
eukprot:TRINITY_DN15360_c0_g1_i7.p1 TRINITY_DN15360_c0_g1~~TRINITY_DN15360_c0_g1_i7.p1  ORF type:complete len:114 (-),score=34.13 TRINITY_DN15360_c0_g1_i7:40-381(-)